MNFDLITKLAKLANNNPSEHEANAAARKVCKLLAEANFKFVETKDPNVGSHTYTDPKTTSPTDRNQRAWDSWTQPRGYEDPIWDILNQMQEAKRRKEEAKRRKEEADRKRREAEEKADKESSVRYPPWEKERSARDPYWGNPFSEKYYNTPPPQPEPQAKSLKCKTCGHYKTTKFVGHPTQYECFECQSQRRPVELTCKICGLECASLGYSKNPKEFVCGNCWGKRY